MTGIFTASSVLTASALNTAINSLALNAQTGTTYTFVLTDAGKLITASNSSAQTYTIPLNASVGYSVGAWIEVLNISTGTVTISPTGGVTLNGTTTVGAGQRVRLNKTATDTWYSHTVGGGGLTFITSASLSGTSVSVNNCFTSTFSNYLILISGVLQASTTSTMRLRAAAADSSAASYQHGRAWIDTTSTGWQAGNGADTSWSFGALTAGATCSQEIVLFNPQAATTTIGFFRQAANNSTAVSWQGFCNFNAATQFDGFSYITAGAMSAGTLRVYGISNS